MAAAGGERHPGGPQLSAEALGGRCCSSPEEATLEVRWGPAGTAHAPRIPQPSPSASAGGRVFSLGPGHSRSSLALCGCRIGVHV